MNESQLMVEINGEKRTYPLETTYREIAEEYQKEYPARIILAKVDGRLRELTKKAENAVRVSFVTVKDKAGYSTYCRSVELLMLKAIYHVVGDNRKIERVGVHFSVSGGYYCTMQGSVPVTQEFLDQVKAYMKELVEKAQPIRKISVPTYEASRRFREYRMYDKEQLVRYRRASRVNIYNLMTFEDYFYGYMAPDTSWLTCFDLRLYEDGFVLLFPSMQEPESLPEFSPSKKIWQVQKDSMEWGARLGIPTVGALNDYIVQNDVKSLIMVQEAFHEKKIAEMAGMIAASPEKKIVLIAGPSSSGKTTFSHRLSTQLAVYGLHPHPIASDDYFVARE